VWTSVSPGGMARGGDGEKSRLRAFVDVEYSTWSAKI
jgi:hypothetical protein